jgi:hypothetical protein
MTIYFERESGPKVHELHVYGTAEDLAKLGDQLKKLASQPQSNASEPMLKLRYPDVCSQYFAGVVFHSVMLERLERVRKNGERKQLGVLITLAVILAVIIAVYFLGGRM